MRAPAVGAFLGLVAAAAGLGTGELVAAFVRPEASPVVAVGNRVIELTPGGPTRTAIDAAGTNDKTLLVASILLLLTALGALVGAKAAERLRLGLVGIGLVTALACYCALTTRAARVTDVIPSLAAGVAAAGVLTVLTRLLRAASAPDPYVTGRRNLLLAAGAGVVTAAAAGLGGRALQSARFDVTGERDRVALDAPPATVPRGADLGRSPVPWRTPNSSFYRIDTALDVPQLSSRDWRLRVHGLVDRPLTIDFEQLLARPQVDRWITINCVDNPVGGGLVGNALWRGALLADLLREAGLQDGCEQLLMRSVDGMTIGAPTEVVMDGRDALLAVGMNGVPLPVRHGYPVRVIVPGLYGYVSACKWITSIEATTYDTDSYWTGKGWGRTPELNLASRIDRPTPGATVSVGETTSIAGVAWDQHVGVAAVEVRINDEPWRAARLAAVPSSDTWRQWVLPWTPPASGEYRLTVRATAADGTPQIAEYREPYPAGGTGLHTVMVRAII